MNLNKYFKQLQIEPIQEVDIRKKCELANKITMLLIDTFPEYDLDYLKIVDLLQHTKMYIVKIPEKLSPVNYLYQEQAIYISDQIELNEKNEFLLHEVIHKIQEYKNKRGQLIQFGICNVFETKIQGLAINEAAIQYIVEKMLKKENTSVEVYEMKIPTISKNYYPIITNLIQQLSLVIGERWIIDSTLNSNEEFKYNAIDYLGEENYFIIQTNFDEILKSKDEILENSNILEEQKIVKKIKTLYIETQQLILTSYFDNIINKIETEKELNIYHKKLIKYRELIGSYEGLENYYKYYFEKEKEIKKLRQNLKNQALIPISDNKIVKIFKKIKDYVEKLIFQN